MFKNPSITQEINKHFLPKEFSAPSPTQDFQAINEPIYSDVYGSFFISPTFTAEEGGITQSGVFVTKAFAPCSCGNSVGSFIDAFLRLPEEDRDLALGLLEHIGRTNK